MTLSDRQIAGAVVAAGFPTASQNTAVAVALAESGGNPTATHVNSDGSTDYGLFQINSVHADLLNKHNWQDPVDNARMALAISSGGSNWAPWTTYTSARYVAFLPRAKRATGNPATPSGGGTGQTSGGTVAAGFPNPITGAKDLWGMLSNPDTWKRVGYVLLGGILLLIGMQMQFDIKGKVIHGAVKAAEVAAV